jgi:RNA polymerase sigma-70 factor, ECF subfamily
MNDEDFDIIRNIQKGQVNDFELLVRKYQSPVFNVLYRMLHQEEIAKEMAQEVFVKAYEHLDTFNFKNRFFSWIYRIAINTAISYRKKQQQYIFTDHYPRFSIESAEDRLLGKEKSALLHKAIGQLKHKYKAVIVLRYFEQLSYAEIAGVLGISESKVKSRLFASRSLLKDLLSDTGYFG